ncbi:type VI secretion system contractile sheath large subunit [Niveispirillum irakense]|uniref:type VI secretion system contractile sheath large subunit n=1 Tax=Niveispirillum irakense TaxID=34011 RepID=UPI00041E4AB3|nr:type VI secretion system contractile sheath large subunit [Niveispirillum irakense]
MYTIDQVLKNSNQSTDDLQDRDRKNITLLIKTVLEDKEAKKLADARVDVNVVDRLIGEIDNLIGAQIDAVLHQPQFQEIEAAWRGLRFLLDRTDFRAAGRVFIRFLDVSKDDLIADFERGGVGADADVTKSDFYYRIYRQGIGQRGADPVAAILGNFTFGSGARDLNLLRNIAKVSAMAHAPFIAAPSPDLLSVKSFDELPAQRDIRAIFDDDVKYAEWNSFRDSEDARYVGLALPRFLLRRPYSPDQIPTKSFRYRENAGPDKTPYLWGNASFAFGTRLTDSFTRWGWCPNIIGPNSGGEVDKLILHRYEKGGRKEVMVPTEILIPDRLDLELSEAGFISLVMRKGSDNAAFVAANSPQRNKVFGDTSEGRQATLNHKLGAQLPYMFIVNRIAHYIKVLQREKLGGWADRVSLEKELNEWLRQYIANMPNPSPEIRSRKPLRDAKITVSEVEDEPGWYTVGMWITPHFKYMGADFTISLTGRLEKTK